MGVWLSKASKGCGKALGGVEGCGGRFQGRESEQLCGSGCSGTIQRLGKVLQGSENAGWEGFWTGLGDLGQSAGRLPVRQRVWNNGPGGRASGRGLGRGPLAWHVPEP